jgi:HD-GYP domain-containing protein (c-di-GMP phosphodiesterase class II)
VNPIVSIANVAAAVIVGIAVLAAILYLPWRTRDAYRQTFIALARAVESREPFLVGHAERTARYVVLMARWRLMTPWATRDLEYAALLHGIGKVGVPYGLLHNPDPLDGGPSSITPMERFVMRDYIRVGAAIVEAIPLLRPVADIVRYHHEYYDGSGYPFGRYGRGIPFPAQMLCVASEYVAMTTPRLYREGAALTPDEAMVHLWRHVGRRYHRSAVVLFFLAKSGEDYWLRVRALCRRWLHTGVGTLPRRVL